MKDKLIKELELLIKDHEENEFCIDYRDAEKSIEYSIEESFDKFYDVGRYNTLKEILYFIQNL
jgi:hypothetical protein